MIAASEPLEFVPHGRTVLAKHPGTIYNGENGRASENSLLYKLTNFAIQDESFLDGKEEPEQEMWLVREVYSRQTNDFDDDDETQSPKETKSELTSESLRPHSRLKNEFNISIKSEIICGLKKMETDCANVGASRPGSANSSSDMSKKFNLTSTRNFHRKKNQKPKPLSHKTDSCYEEELYVKGRTAVWSKGLMSTPATRLSLAECRETIACYTCEGPIKHATFCEFHINFNNGMLIDALNSQIGDHKKNIKIEDSSENMNTKVMPSVLLIDNKSIRVFGADGREYLTGIPFQVKKVWPMKYGTLLEKDATPLVHNSLFPISSLKFNDTNNSSFSKSRAGFPINMSSKYKGESTTGFDTDFQLPTCFSLSHPLDEVTPILMKSPSHGLQYYNDGDHQIMFVSTSPSIILIYDWKLGTHSLWKIRRSTRDECLSVCPGINASTTLLSQSCNFGASISSFSNIGVKNQAPSLAQKNTAASWIAGVGSPFPSKPGLGTPMMSRSKLNSPMANAFYQQGMSPHTSIGQASSMSMMANTMQQAPPSLPLYPDICLDHIWTDSQAIRRDPVSGSIASKSFLHTDLVGHDYLCYMVQLSGATKLQLIRLQNSHSNKQTQKTNLIVGASSTIPAKDAVVLDHLKMIALIDETGNIVLYSGTCIVGKVHVGGVLARLIDSPYSKRSAFNSPFPRRSSLLPSRSNDISVFDDSAIHCLSPVPHSTAPHVERKEALGLQGLCDPVGSRLTLKFDKGALYRITLPDVTCSSLVLRCLNALKCILPKDITMQVIVKWYGVRNAPGTQDLNLEQEWSMFASLLFTLIGYDIERLTTMQQSDEPTEVVTKKQRTSSDGTQDDWEYLLNTKLHKTLGEPLANLLHLKENRPEDFSQTPMLRKLTDNQKKLMDTDSKSQFNYASLLYNYIIQILYSLHLVYEETKLNTLLYDDLKPLSGFLYQLSKDLKLNAYICHYWKDFSNHNLDYDIRESQLNEQHLQRLSQPNYFTFEPPNIFSYLNCLLKSDDNIGSYPYLLDVNVMSKNLVEVVGYISSGTVGSVQPLSSARSEGINASSTPRPRDLHTTSDATTLHRNTVMMLCEKGITPRAIDNLPPAISLLLLDTLSRCKNDAPVDWPIEAYHLIMREDLALQSEVADKVAINSEYMESLAFEVLEKETAYTQVKPSEPESSQTKPEENDIRTGMEHLDTKILRLLYPCDHRMAEVCNLLQSSIPVVINLTQRPEVSDHDFIEEQEKHLYAISTRTMALPIARGMLTLRTVACVPTEPLTLPKLCVSGRGPPPRCNTIELSGGGGENPPHCTLWPTFHNGVAAGLSLVSMAGSNIDSSWVIYNKPKGAADMSTEHAGFLMALGLNGHLKDMAFMNIYEYLVKCQEMTSVGLLLGLAATYRGTMDVQATKMMSIHLEPLLPPTSIELDIHQNILVAALMGVGLIYQGTMHAHYAEVLLNEIGRPPGPEMENCMEREGYSLAAGLALGLVSVGAHATAPAHLAHHLRHYMLGGNKHPVSGAQKEKYKLGSFAVREGSTVNLDVTSPGATLALGLLYLNSGNRAVAEWLAPPDTHYLLYLVRPDLLMLRIIARGLIMWESIQPYEEWVEGQVPSTIKPYCFVKPIEDNIDYEAMNQAYCNIVAGACFCIGLRFAGSGDEDARDCLMDYVNQFISLSAKSIGELAGKSTIESCLNVILLSVGMVMSGRGDVGVLRACRRLRARPSTPAAPLQPSLTHGGQVAVHCTIGLLFLGGGRCTLGTSPTHIAALLAAFFPKLPTHSNDNRYHLQAFRHLYVLAVEPRLLLPRDINTGKLCYADIQVVSLEGHVTSLCAPCILPPLHSLSEVRICDPRYWPIVFQKDRNWNQLVAFLEYSWCIDIKQRAGCLSYLEDPQGFLTLLAQTLTLDQTNIWSASPENITSFTSDEKVRNFTKHYLGNIHKAITVDGKTEEVPKMCSDCLLLRYKKSRDSFKGVEISFPANGCRCRKFTQEEKQFAQGLSMVTYECVVKDMLCILPIWTTFLKILSTMKNNPSVYHMWQIKLLISQIENHNRRYPQLKQTEENSLLSNESLISNEFTWSIKQKVSEITDSWEFKLVSHIQKYLGLPSSVGNALCDETTQKLLSAFVVYYDLPKDIFANTVSEDVTLLHCLMELDELNLDVNAVSKITALVS